MLEEIKVGEIVRLVHAILAIAGMGTDDAEPIADGWRQQLISDLESLLPITESLGLDVSSQYVEDSLKALAAGPRRGESGAMSRAANMIANTIQIQTRKRLFFVLQSDSAKLFNAACAFGPPAKARFSDATWEMQESAKCLALSRPTAGAFHAIRCLEAGIRALSRSLAIPDPTRASDRNWGKTLKSLKDGIDTRWPGSTSRMTGDGEFFDNAYAALAAMQNPWRNSTMHLDQKYTDDDAKHIFDVVTGFMLRIAARMDEEGEPKA